MIIFLDCTLPYSSFADITSAKRDLPEKVTGRHIIFCWSCFEWGLHSLLCYQRSGGLLHHHSTLTCRSRRSLFCCTSLGVTSTGRYPAPCPTKPGLSSPYGAIICITRINNLADISQKIKKKNTT